MIETVKALVRHVSLTVVVVCIFTIPLIASQVVKEEDRGWARGVLAQEKGFEARAEGDTLAVLYFENATGEARLNPLQKGIALMLMTDLSQVEGVQLVERVSRSPLAEEMELGVSGLVEKGSMPRVGRLLGARYLVGGGIRGGAGQLGIFSDMLEVPAEKVSGSVLSEGDFSKVLEMEKEILFGIIELLKIRLDSGKKRELSRPMTRSIDALYNLVYAIDSSDRGEYAKAGAFYRAALKADPELGIAKEGLDELKELGLIADGDRSRALAKQLDSKTSRTGSLSPDYASKRERDPGDLGNTTGQIRVQW